jgi:LAO/AO transport system kinase
MAEALDSIAVNPDLAGAVTSGDRRALARAITLVESTRAADQKNAEALLTKLLPHTGRAIRVGISGAPGVGKSTFIEAFGQHLTGRGLRVAVFAIDPSSRRSGGSILGDKTRMEKLARSQRLYPPIAGGYHARRRRAAHARIHAARRGREL